MQRKTESFNISLKVSNSIVKEKFTNLKNFFNLNRFMIIAFNEKIMNHVCQQLFNRTKLVSRLIIHYLTEKTLMVLSSEYVLVFIVVKFSIHALK